MNLIRSFENRVAEVLGAAPQGYTAPFSFRKLAKIAAKQMEAETFVIDGVDTAPALYTVLVSPADDAAIRPLYAKLTSELVALIKAQAQTKRYVFVGEPLARFLVDPHLRSGKFDVFAENIDAVTLERLRIEERAFLNGASAVGGAAAERKASHSVRRPTRRGTYAQQAAYSARSHEQAASEPLVPIIPPTAAPMPPLDEEPVIAGSEAPVVANPASSIPDLAISIPPVIPEALDGDDVAPVAPVAAVAAVAPVAAVAAADSDILTSPASSGSLDDPSMGLDIVPTDFLDDRVSASSLSVPKIPDIEVPATQRRVPPVDAPEANIFEDGIPVLSDEPASCLLVDHQTGRTYLAIAPVTIIGRERSSCGIVLLDPNVSRRHAELIYDEASRTWRLHDLGSTNGSLVNDVEVAQCVLHDGDLLTIGLMNLEFKEG